MADPIDPQATGGTPPASPSGQEPQAPRTYTDADIAKARRKAEKERDELKAELDALKSTQKSEQEKAIEAAREDGRKQVESVLNKERLDGAVRRALLAEGLDEELAAVVVSRNPDGFEDTAAATSAAKAYASEFKQKIKSSHRIPVVPGSPASQIQSEKWSSSKVRKLNRTEFLRNHKAIQEAKTTGNFIYD